VRLRKPSGREILIRKGEIVAEIVLGAVRWFAQLLVIFLVYRMQTQVFFFSTGQPYL